jgi:hypothetical protein
MPVAEDWIWDYSGQLSFFSEEDPNKLLHLDHSSFLGVKCTYVNRQIQRIQREIGFDILPSLLQDLSEVRIFEPASKLRSLDFLDQYFGK